MIRSEWSS
ncbi:hypothetical protein CGLO_13201 [Colletotrichum gloeosporioides Cg-14]|uniref:Uncharacterized protein n=1 Tax=Colletotrichum gloeosporioides (strain Cg-14) TaxID=1237896 RepID=T0JWZ4_COLGC|nr:hypothetical protein CGLO_13201 [Colletotrichum gloeosporioides Cg-14]